MVLSTFLILRKYTDLKKYTWFTGISTVLIGVSVIYLGIHWLLDVVAGVLLGVFVLYTIDLITARCTANSIATEPGFQSTHEHRAPIEADVEINVYDELTS
jgi:hypothetical protein